MEENAGRPEQVAVPPRTTSRFDRLWKVCGIALAFVVLLVAGAIGTLYLWSEIAYRSAMKEAGTHGIPATWDEAKPPAIPNEDNAADDYRSAFALMAEVDKKLRAIPAAPGGSGFVPHECWYEFEKYLKAGEKKEVVTAVLPYLSEYGEVVALLVRASHKPHVQLDSLWATYDLKELASMRSATRLLMMNAFVALQEKRFNDAAQYICTSIRIDEHLGRHTLLIVALVRNVMRWYLYTVVQQALKADLPDDTLRQLADALTGPSDGGFFYKTMRVEVASFLATYQKLIDGRVKLEQVVFHSYPPGDYSYAGCGLAIRFDRVFYLTQMNRTIDSVKMPMSEGFDASTLEPQTYPFYARFSKFAFNGIYGLPRWAAGCAIRDLMKFGVALRRYELRNGRFPEKLDQLVSTGLLDELPPDPCSGKPYHYIVRGREMTVYSNGRNAVDDGGVTASLPEDGDILLQLELLHGEK